MSGEMRTVKDAVFELLARRGMTTVFGNPGSTELRFLRDWPEGFRYVTALHEQSVVAMADAYAQIARRPVLVNLHSAGGLGNAMGSVYTAFKNQSPVVITAGQQTRAMLPFDPYLYADDATMLPRPYVKWSIEPARAADVPRAIERGCAIAMQRPYGPVFISIPEDDWDAPAGRVEPRTIAENFVGDPAALGALAELLERCARPALVVGPGVDRDDASAAAVALAERVRAAVWASPVSSRCSFPERHPLFAGFLPPVRTHIAKVLAPYDAIVVLGAPVFTFHVDTAAALSAPGAALVQLVDDPAAAASACEGTAIVTSLRGALDALFERLTPATRESPPPRAAAPAPPMETPISGAFALAALARALPPDAIVCEEAPTHRPAMHEQLRIERPGGFFAAASGSLGWAFPAAVGAAFAAPGRRTVALAGDGSSMYAIQALWTAAHHRLPVSFVVLNNRGYGAMKEFSRYLRFDGAPSFDLDGLDLVRCAEGFGVAGVRVERPNELDAAFARSFAAAGPSLVDIAVDERAGIIY